MIPITIEKDSPNIAKLTKATDSYFKILFDYSIEERYKISSIETALHPNGSRVFNEQEKAELYKAFCNFIEESTNMTFTDVQKKYGRTPDANDKAVDSRFSNEEFPMEHYSMSKTGLGSIARVHGYIRESIFIVKRIDWGHAYHKKRPSR